MASMAPLDLQVNKAYQDLMVLQEFKEFKETQAHQAQRVV